MAMIISPSILSADFAHLGDEVNAVLAAGADWIHFDVMDNHYVPNLTIGPLVCEALRKSGITAPIDVHLMVSPVDQIVPDFAKAGATYISFHPEATLHVDRTIQLIRDSGCRPGLVFNPATPLNWLDYVIDKIDLVLVMSVNRVSAARNSSRPPCTSSRRRARASRRRSATSVWRSTVESKWTMPPRLPGPARTPSSPVRPYSAARIMRPRSRRCGNRWP